MNLRDIWDALKVIILVFKRPEPIPSIITPMPQDPPIQKRDMLKELCTYIRDYEGKPGDRNYRNNNPGNCRYSSVGYLAKYGTVGKDKDGFAIFKDYATGFLYLENLIKYKINKNPTWTLLDLISNWAPSADHNNPLMYTENVAGRLRVGIDYPAKNILG